MDALAAATRTAAAVSTVGSHFMLDGNTYKRGAELGFQGLDFYVTGRGGVLGDVDADVVSAAFTFFEPGAVRTLWEQGREVMPAEQAGREFAACAAAWAEHHVPDDLDAARLADLAGRVVADARPACAAVFAGFRALPGAGRRRRPGRRAPDERPPRAAPRAARRGGDRAPGLSPLEALSLKTPHMAPIFGWAELADVAGLQPRWDDAEARTTEAIAHAYEGLDDAERAELADLAGVPARGDGGMTGSYSGGAQELDDAERARLTAERDRIRAAYLTPATSGPPSSARGVHHVALICADVERTTRFYQEVLGFPLTDDVREPRPARVHPLLLRPRDRQHHRLLRPPGRRPRAVRRGARRAPPPRHLHRARAVARRPRPASTPRASPYDHVDETSPLLPRPRRRAPGAHRRPPPLDVRRASRLTATLLANF